MKLLLVPMLAAGQTDGPFSRVKTLANAFLRRGCHILYEVGAARITEREEGISK